MKEHYVSYPQAVKLKELGFDEPCEFYYNPYQELRISKDCLLAPKITNNRFLEEIVDGMATAPRLDQAQAWLREVKGIFVYTKPILRSVGDEELQDFKFILKGYRFHVIKLDNAYHSTSYDYPTDEQALSAGIDAALELLTNKP